MSIVVTCYSFVPSRSCALRDRTVHVLHAGVAVKPGSVVALVTPMDDSGAVDHDTLTALLQWHIGQGETVVVNYRC
jgi:hypothetical protein